MCVLSTAANCVAVTPLTRLGEFGFLLWSPNKLFTSMALARTTSSSASRSVSSASLMPITPVEPLMLLLSRFIKSSLLNERELPWRRGLQSRLLREFDATSAVGVFSRLGFVNTASTSFAKSRHRTGLSSTSLGYCSHSSCISSVVSLNPAMDIALTNCGLETHPVRFLSKSMKKSRRRTRSENTRSFTCFVFVRNIAFRSDVSEGGGTFREEKSHKSRPMRERRRRGGIARGGGGRSVARENRRPGTRGREEEHTAGREPAPRRAAGASCAASARV